MIYFKIKNALEKIVYIWIISKYIRVYICISYKMVEVHTFLVNMSFLVPITFKNTMIILLFSSHFYHSARKNNMPIYSYNMDNCQYLFIVNYCNVFWSTFNVCFFFVKVVVFSYWLWFETYFYKKKIQELQHVENLMKNCVPIWHLRNENSCNNTSK